MAGLQPWNLVFYNRVNELLHQRHAWIVKMVQEFRRREALPVSDPYHARKTPTINAGHGDGASPCSSKKLGRRGGVAFRTIGIYVYIGHLRRLYRLKADQIARGEMNHEMFASTIPLGLVARRESAAPPLVVGDRVRVRRAVQKPRYNWGEVSFRLRVLVAISFTREEDEDQLQQPHPLLRVGVLRRAEAPELEVRVLGPRFWTEIQAARRCIRFRF